MSSPYGIFKSNWKHEVSIRSIKILDVGYLFATSSVIGYIVARTLSNIFKFDKKNYEINAHGKIRLIVEILLEMALIGMLVYASRQIIQALPFPLDGNKGWNAPEGFVGFRHNKLREWENPFPIAFLIILFQDSLKAKIAYFTEITSLI